MSPGKKRKGQTRKRESGVQKERVGNMGGLLIGNNFTYFIQLEILLFVG